MTFLCNQTWDVELKLIPSDDANLFFEEYLEYYHYQQ